MPFPKLSIRNPAEGTPRQAVPVRLASFILGIEPEQLVTLVYASGQPEFQVLQVYEYAKGAPTLVRAKSYHAIGNQIRRQSSIASKISAFPTDHFVWSDELAQAFSESVHLYSDQKTAAKSGEHLDWRPSVGAARGVISQCVSLSKVQDPRQLVRGRGRPRQDAKHARILATFKALRPKFNSDRDTCREMVKQKKTEGLSAATVYRRFRQKP